MYRNVMSFSCSAQRPARRRCGSSRRAGYRHGVDWRCAMNEHVYKKLELTGSSTAGIEEAVANALDKASKTIRNMQWFEVVDTRGHIDGGKVAHWQVTIKVGFTLED